MMSAKVLWSNIFIIISAMFCFYDNCSADVSISSHSCPTCWVRRSWIIGRSTSFIVTMSCSKLTNNCWPRKTVVRKSANELLYGQTPYSHITMSCTAMTLCADSAVSLLRYCIVMTRPHSGWRCTRRCENAIVLMSHRFVFHYHPRTHSAAETAS